MICADRNILRRPMLGGRSVEGSARQVGKRENCPHILTFTESMAMIVVCRNLRVHAISGPSWAGATHAATVRNRKAPKPLRLNDRTKSSDFVRSNDLNRLRATSRNHSFGCANDNFALGASRRTKHNGSFAARRPRDSGA